MAANHATAAALLLIVIAAPILEASGSEQATVRARPGRQLAGTRTRTRTREVPSMWMRCMDVHGVKAGETCGSLARAARLSDAGFRNLNPNITCVAVFPGQWVCLAGAGVA